MDDHKSLEWLSVAIRRTLARLNDAALQASLHLFLTGKAETVASNPSQSSPGGEHSKLCTLPPPLGLVPLAIIEGESLLGCVPFCGSSSSSQAAAMLERLKGIGFDECLVSQSSDTSSGTSGRLSSAELGVVWDGNGELQTLSGVFHRAIRDGRSSNESRDESAKEKSAGSAVYRVLIVRTVGGTANPEYVRSRGAGGGGTRHGPAAAASWRQRHSSSSASSSSTGVTQRFLSEVLTAYRETRAKLLSASSTQRLHLAVVLVTEDRRGVGSSLLETLEPHVATEMAVRCFHGGGGQTGRAAGCHTGEGAPQESQASYSDRTAFAVLRSWLPSAAAAAASDGRLPSSLLLPPSSPLHINSTSSSSTNHHQKRPRDVGEGGRSSEDEELHRFLVSSSNYFLLRPRQLPFAWLLYFLIQLFPMMIPPAAFRSLWRVWSDSHHLGDVAMAFHTIWVTHMDTTRGSCVGSSSGTSSPSGSPDILTMDVLDQVYGAAATMASTIQRQQYGYNASPNTHVEAVCFTLLYQEAIHVCHAAPPYQQPLECSPSLRNPLAPYPAVIAALAARQKASAEPTDGSHSLPSATAVPSPQPPPLMALTAAGAVISSLQRTALLSSLPPLHSLAQWAAFASNSTRATKPGGAEFSPLQCPHTRSEGQHPPTSPSHSAVSCFNYYNEAGVSAELRILHYLTAADALHQTRAHCRDVPLAQLQWVTQLSDEVLLTSLEVLSRLGYVTVNLKHMTAATALVSVEDTLATA